MEKISVCVPIYNSLPYLRNCIESICRQTYQNLEILLVDDGSNDGTSQLCQELQQSDSRIRLFHQENKGIGATRNQLLNLARGEYILFVDNDDWLEDNHIEVLYRLLKETDSDIAIANFTEFREGVFYKYITEEHFYKKIFSSQEWFQYQYRSEYNLSQCFTVPWGKLYKKKVFHLVDYPTNTRIEDDYTTWKTYLNATKIAYINQDLYIHRKSTTSVSTEALFVDVYPLASILERICHLSILGFSISNEIQAFHWRAEQHLAYYQSIGDEQELRKNKVIIKKNVNITTRCLIKIEKTYRTPKNNRFNSCLYDYKLGICSL
ncbi:glycosyltransferase family 2 protein [Streptococcus suis]